jgi:hypothetical protein
VQSVIARPRPIGWRVTIWNCLLCGLADKWLLHAYAARNRRVKAGCHASLILCRKDTSRWTEVLPYFEGIPK